MLKKIISAILLSMLTSITSVSAEETQNDVFQTEHTNVYLYHNGHNDAIVRFVIDPQWHIYWRNPGDIGYPTLIHAAGTSLTNFEQSVPQVRTMYETMNEYIYENSAFFAFSGANLSTDTITVEFAECFDVCKAEKISFDLNKIPPTEAQQWQEMHTRAAQTFPQQLQISAPTDHNQLTLNMPLTEPITFLPAESDVVAPESIMINTQPDATVITWQNSGPDKLQQALILSSDNAYMANIIYTPAADFSLAYIILLAFLGGIILNAMPCVFPILSLKIFTLLKNKPHQKPWRSSLLYTIGVVTSFLILTTCLLIFKKQGEALGWGFQLQSPLFVGIMAIIFYILFAFMMEWLHFPALSNKFVHQAANLNDFCTGFFAVLIASPCTGPFMGAAVGYAFLHGSYELYIIFLALALGYALPYALIELHPQALSRIFPKPGRWMKRVKTVLAIPILLTAFWLTSVFWTQTGISLFTDSKSSLDWKPYDYEVIDNLNSAGENIFIDFTADWCLTCKFNEKLIINTAKFKQFVTNHNVHLFMADLTENNEYYSEALNYFGRDSIPLYVYYHQGKYTILPLFFSAADLEKIHNQGDLND